MIIMTKPLNEANYLILCWKGPGFMIYMIYVKIGLEAVQISFLLSRLWSTLIATTKFKYEINSFIPCWKNPGC